MKSSTEKRRLPWQLGTDCTHGTHIRRERYIYLHERVGAKPVNSKSVYEDARFSDFGEKKSAKRKEYCPNNAREI